MPKGLIYSRMQPSGADFGAPAERAMERMIANKRARQTLAAKKAKEVRDARDKRDKYASDAFTQDVFVKQAGVLSEQVMRLNDEVQSNMLELVDRYIQTGNSEDQIALNKYKWESQRKAESIGVLLEKFNGVNQKFVETGKDGKPVYSLELNADKQILLNQIMAGKGYDLDLNEFTITTPEGETVDALDFMNNNFKDLAKYIDPNDAVDEYFKNIDRSPFDTHQMEWQGEDGKVHSKTVYKTDYNNLKSTLFDDFEAMFGPESLAFQEYAAQTDDPAENLAEQMFKRGARRNGFMFERVKTEESIQTPSVTERKKAKSMEDTTKFLIDMASGGTESGGEGILKDISRTTETGGMEKVYKSERFMNPQTGEIGLAIHTTNAKGETQPPIIIDNLATPQGAAELLEMAVGKKGYTYMRYDELNINSEQLAEAAAKGKEGLSEERKQALKEKALEIGPQVAMDKVFADIGNEAFKKNNIQRTLETLFTTLSNYVPADVLERVKQRVGVSSGWFGRAKAKDLEIDNNKYSTLNADSKKVIISAIADVVKEEYAKSQSQPNPQPQPINPADTIDVSPIFNQNK